MPPAISTANANILQHYQEIAAISGHMLLKAQAKEWDELVRLGELYQEAVEQLKKLEPLSHSQREARRKLLKRILDDDARIRQLVSPELERLGLLLGNYKRQRTVLQTYYSSVRPE